MKKLSVKEKSLVTVEQIKKMDINELISQLEEKLGRRLDGGSAAFLAMANGAGKVHTINLDEGEAADESLNYEKLAEILNGPEHPPMPPYTGPKVIIEDTEHFVKAFFFALEHTPDPFDVEKIREEDSNYKTPIESFIDAFQHLAIIAGNYAKNGYHFQVSPDFVDNSFYFVCLDGEEKFCYNGGIILSKDWNAGKYVSNHKMRWSIHT